MSVEKLAATTSNVLAYALLELLSLASVSVVLQRKLRISALHQLALVLATQWQQVQAKLYFWVFMSVQSLLQHYGVDFTFRFAWLHSRPQSTA